jgi:hypothetical protein
MLDQHEARRPAQVNACFAGGAGRQGEIVAALRQAGLAADQITVIEHPGPERETPPGAAAGPGFLDRLAELFGGEQGEEPLGYDLLILAHLGDDERRAGPVQEALRRLGAARVSYYPPAEAEMHVLGGGPSPVLEPSPGPPVPPPGPRPGEPPG